MTNPKKHQPNQAKTLLDRANASIEGMRGSRNLDELEEKWKDFLHCLERAWNKLNSCQKRNPSWDGWIGRYRSLRSSDPLLAYLKNARDADEHTVQTISHREPGGVTINPATGDSLFIKEMRIIDGKIWINSPQRLKLGFTPAKIGLLEVKNKGIVYPVPTIHLGKAINPKNIIGIAEAGFAFYERLFRDSITKFPPSK